MFKRLLFIHLLLVVFFTLPVLASAPVILHNPTHYNNLSDVWAGLIQALLILVGTASLAVFVYGGFLFLTSSGNSETIKKARNTIVYALLGIFISLGAYIILKDVFGVFQGIFS